jgi:hypothetical protein
MVRHVDDRSPGAARERIFRLPGTGIPWPLAVSLSLIIITVGLPSLTLSLDGSASPIDARVNSAIE